MTTRELELLHNDVILLGEAESPVRVAVSLVDEQDASVVSTRTVQEIDEAEAQARADREVLRTLYDAQKAISRATDFEDVLDVVAERVFTILERATHVTVAMREEDPDGRAPSYVPIGSRVRGRKDRLEPVPITRSVLPPPNCCS